MAVDQVAIYPTIVWITSSAESQKGNNAIMFEVLPENSKQGIYTQ